MDTKLWQGMMKSAVHAIELDGANMKHNLEVMFGTLYDRARALKSRLLSVANFRSGGELSGQSRPNPLQLKYPLLGERG